MNTSIKDGNDTKRYGLLIRILSSSSIKVPPACCHLFVVGRLSTSMTRTAMLAGVFILLFGPLKPDRLKG